jgi:hypothetical protein
MRIIFAILLSISAVMPGYGQQKHTLSGLVRDRSSGEPLIGANVVIMPEGTGTVSDAYGFYSLQAVTGIAEVRASYVGYKIFMQKIGIKENARLDIYLERGLELSEVEVSGNRPAEARAEMGMTELTAAQVKALPMLGEPDLLKVMQLLPGIQGGADGRSGLYVRGGSPDQNLFMLDGTSIYYVNHLGGFVSVFHPDILQNIKLYKGGFPARFGGRLSSVTDLRMKEGNKKELKGSYGIGLISGDFTLEGPIKTNKTSFIVSTRRVWIDFLLRPATKIGLKHFSMGYNFYDFFGKVSHEANDRNRIYFSLYGGDDRLGFFFSQKKDKIRSNARFLWGNQLATLRWNHIYNPKLNSDITLVYTRYRYRNNLFYKSDSIRGMREYGTAVYDFGLKADHNWWLAHNYTMRFGGGISGNWFVPGQITSEFTEGANSSKETIGAQNRTRATNLYAYLENEYSPFPWLSVNAGLRVVNYKVGHSNYFSAEPRLLASFYHKNAGAIKIGYTQMVQPVHMLTYSGTVFPTDIWLPSTPWIAPSVARQYAVGYSKTIREGAYELNIELYKKEMEDLIEAKGGTALINTGSWEDGVETGGTGCSKGVEFMLQKNKGVTTGWVSYTWSNAERQFENLNNGRPYPFKYDRRHDLSIVFNRQLKPNVDFSATWVYGSGYPTTLHNGVYPAITPDGYGNSPYSDPFSVDRGTAYLYPGKNWLRMRDYHRLDLGINFRKEIKKGSGLRERTWTIGLYNAYNQQNAVYYYFARKYEDSRPNNPILLFQQSGFPVIPSVKYSVKF